MPAQEPGADTGAQQAAASGDSKPQDQPVKLEAADISFSSSERGGAGNQAGTHNDNQSLEGDEKDRLERLKNWEKKGRVKRRARATEDEAGDGGGEVEERDGKERGRERSASPRAGFTSVESTEGWRERRGSGHNY